LAVLPPSIVTRFIEEIVSYSETIIINRFAYESYFSCQSFADTGCYTCKLVSEQNAIRDCWQESRGILSTMAEGDEAAVATFVGESIMCDFALWKALKSPDEPQLPQSVLTPVLDALTHFRTSVRDSAPLDSIALTKHSDLWLHHLRPVDISDQQQTVLPAGFHLSSL
jgi:hypothetical protein